MEIFIDYIKPGASEFKRSENAGSLLFKIINAYKEFEGKTISEINKNDGDSPSPLFRALVEEDVLKVNKIKEPLLWNDRYTSLFIRQGILNKDKKTKVITLSNMSRFILQKSSNDFDYNPFSNDDFLLLLFTSTMDCKFVDELGNKINYVTRAIDILKSFREGIEHGEFYKRYIIKDLDKQIGIIKENKDNESWIKELTTKLVKSGSGSEGDNSSISKIGEAIINFFISIWKGDDIEIKRSFSYLKNKSLSPNEKKWINYLFNTYNGELKEFSSTAKNYSEKIDEVIKFASSYENGFDLYLSTITTFGYYKKSSEYTTLVKMYVTKLPIFEFTSTHLSLNKKMRKTIDKLKNAIDNNKIDRSVFDETKISDFFNEIKCDDELINLDELTGDKFYPELNDSLLEEVIVDEELWIKRSDSKLQEYQKKIKGINKDNLPSYYEFLTILFLYKKYKKSNANMIDFRRTINTHLDSNHMPILYASSGLPDSVFRNKEGEIAIVEPTLVVGSSQAKHEFNIDKHARDAKAKWAILVAPKIDSRTKERFYINNIAKKEHEKSWMVNMVGISNESFKKIFNTNLEDVLVEEHENTFKFDIDF